ncbi:hypothetical protein AZE42_13901 [Rhizopogon vesiculosus]|uniref:Uncharacterized protein n=1 Tax=Rhizopogon vesiculosus TaxID=180088 RepID=A0A1J8QY43_9AGAM|nr:hypothetical protein AZE42_13901 [Rhizopogon vesiculosus]
MQFGIWETRIRLSDRDKREKEKREKEAAREVVASSPAPDDDIEMGSLLPPTLTKKRSIVEPKPVTPSDLHDPPCDNCRRLRNNPVCTGVKGRRCTKCVDSKQGCSLLGSALSRSLFVHGVADPFE